ETGSGRGAGTTLNVSLPAGCDDERYLAALDRALEGAAAFGGSFVVVSLGLDTYREDPICDFALTTAAYEPMGRAAASVGSPLVVVQEGGYFLPDLGRNVLEFLRGAAAVPRG